jgi:hypothetical protein
MSRPFSNRANVTSVIELNQTPELLAVSRVTISSLETIASHCVRTSQWLVTYTRSLTTCRILSLYNPDNLAKCIGSGGRLMLAVALNRRAEAGLSNGRRAIPAPEHCWKAETPASPPPHHHLPITTSPSPPSHHHRPHGCFSRPLTFYLYSINVTIYP